MPKPKATEKGESIAGYFRPILESNRELLKGRSNAKLFEMWLADHPEHTKVPQPVINALANVKSSLRKKLKIKKRKGKAAAAASEAPAAAVVAVVAKLPRTARASLETLEVKIDDCMSLARGMDPTGLEEVIRWLRAARNKVVQMSGGQ
jgi:hypothetical protein